MRPLDWSDEGIVLRVSRHGETSSIVTLLTRHHGRHAGLVRGGAGRRHRGTLQTGNSIKAHWRARLADHLGTMTVELLEARAAACLAHGLSLAGLSAACAVVERALPERELHPAIHQALEALLDTIVAHAGEADEASVWGPALVTFEIGLLHELGFGLDLSHCAVTGATTDLAYVSPNSGKAVSISAAGTYKDRLLKLPTFLGGSGGETGAEDIHNGLLLSGYFLAAHVFADNSGNGANANDSNLPPARQRLLEAI